VITGKGNISLNKILTHVCPSKNNGNEKKFHLPFLDSKLKENYSPFRAVITAKNEIFNMVSEKESNSLLLKEKLLILNPLNYRLYQPLIFIPNDGLAVCSDNLVCFRIDESMVDVEYLLNELNKEYFKKQLFPRIDVCKQQWVVEEFLSLYIQIPDCETSVERQRILYNDEKLKYLKSINQSYGYDIDAIVTNKASNLPEGTLLYNGKYKVLECLRNGGFGKTYKAMGYFKIGGKTIKSEVAIKEFFMSRIQKRDAETLKVVTSLEKLDEVSSSRKKFMVEAEKIKQFSDHPHIVDVYDVFDENDTCYYTMEYIEGGSLMDYVEQTETCTLLEEEALKIIREVASALSAMHSHRMNHLDVKPENILMSEEGKAVLIDFGAAHKFSNDDEASSLLAITSGGFSPLEIGKIKDFSPSTDIYSLGATLYWLLTGDEPPREGLSERDEKPECISDEVWKVLSLSLRTFREDRPQSIEEFLALLD
jgi:predicted Ser/Thr protein kinase